jgi:hypothetical protein
VDRKEFPGFEIYPPGFSLFYESVLLKPLQSTIAFGTNKHSKKPACFADCEIIWGDRKSPCSVDI